MKSIRRGKRGGRRENAGRKAIWKNSDTMTIRVPKIIATQVMEIAHRLDSGENIDFDTQSISGKNELVTESNLAKFDSVTKTETQSDAFRGKHLKSDRVALLPSDSDDEKITKSKPEFKSEFETSTNDRAANSEIFESVTKSIKSMHEAIELAKKILKQKKSARHTVAKLLSKLYSSAVSFDDLK